MIDKIKAEIENCIVQNMWEDCNELCRAYFTTLCLLEGWEIATKPIENYLSYLYGRGDIESIDISFEDFYEYMVELIDISLSV